MKKTARILAIFLMITLLCGVFCACHKTKDDPATKRTTAIDNVANTFLSGVDDTWTKDMSIDKIASLDNAGEYIVANGWLDLVCNVLNKSNMQTAKLNLLADTLASEDGKKLVGEFSSNAELLIPLLKDVGFSSEDISSLAYLLVVEITSNGESTIRSMIDTLDDVKDALTSSQSSSISKIDNLNENRASAERTLEVIKMSGEERDEILSALAKAESAFNELVEFAYDTSVGSITDELYDSLVSDEGILGSVNEEEIAIVVRAMLANVQDLADALSKDDIANLNSALDLFIKHFDNNQITSSLYAQIVVYAKYAYMVVDVIPSICDVVLAGSDVLANKDFIEDILKVAKQAENGQINSQTNSINTLILIARMVEGIMRSDSFRYVDIMTFVDQINVSGKDAYQKAMPLIALDLMLNITTFVENPDGDSLNAVHPNIVEKDDLTTMVGALLLSACLDQFKEAYYTYTATGDADSYTKMFNMATWCAFEYFADESNPYNPSTQTKSWYNWCINTALPKANSKISSCVSVVRDDFKAFVNDYFADDSSVKSAIHTLANMSIIEENLSESEVSDNYMALLCDSRLLGFAYVFQMIA